MKKILSLVLALTMLFSVAVTVSAEVSLSDYVFKGKGLDLNDDTIYTYTFGKFTGDPDEVGVKILGNKDYKLSDEALATAKANGGLFGIGLADTNNVISGSTYTVTPYTVTDGVREDGTGKEIDKNMEETVVDVPLQVTNIKLTNTADSTEIYNGGIREDLLKYPEYDLDESGNPKTTVFGKDIFKRVTRVFADQSHIYIDFPKEMEGANIIETNRGVHPSNPLTVYTVEFTLNKTATLYFNSTTTYGNNAGATKLTNINYSENKDYNTAITKEYTPNTLGNASKNIWKLKCEVPEGEENKTFKITIQMQAYVGPMLFIKE